MRNSIRIADTTREEREQIVAESIGNISGLCDGVQGRVYLRCPGTGAQRLRDRRRIMKRR